MARGLVVDMLVGAVMVTGLAADMTTGMAVVEEMAGEMTREASPRDAVTAKTPTSLSW